MEKRKSSRRFRFASLKWIKKADAELRLRGTSFDALMRRIVYDCYPERPITIRGMRFNADAVAAIREAVDHPERLRHYETVDELFAALKEREEIGRGC